MLKTHEALVAFGYIEIKGQTEGTACEPAPPIDSVRRLAYTVSIHRLTGIEPIILILQCLGQNTAATDRVAAGESGANKWRRGDDATPLLRQASFAIESMTAA